MISHHFKKPHATARRLMLVAGLSPSVAWAAEPHPAIIQRLINVAVLHGPFGNPWEDTQRGSGLRFAATLLGYILGTLLALLGIVYLLLVIGAGFRWMIARGNEPEIEKAKSSLKNASMGLMIVASAYAVVALVSLIIKQTGLLSLL